MDFDNVTELGKKKEKGKASKSIKVMNDFVPEPPPPLLVVTY